MSRTFLLVCLVAGTATVQAQVTLYGTATMGGPNFRGTLYSISSDGTQLQVLHGFSDSPDGNSPAGSLISDTSSKLYGVTQYGGTNGTGTIFSYDTATHVYQKVFDFTNTDGKGSFPAANLTLFQHKLYGFTIRGGANGVGTLYSFDPVTDSVTDIFDLPDRGVSFYVGSYAAPTFLDGKIYFNTNNGGVNNQGMLAAIDPAAGTFTDLHDFQNNYAQYPNPTLVVIDSVLYGADVRDLYSYDPRNGTYTDLYDFLLSGGLYPDGVFCYGITVSKDKNIYGTMNGGGIYGDGGTLFRFDPVTRQYTVLHTFNSNAGGASFNESYPYDAPLIVGDTMIFGTTSTYDGGAVFSYDLIDSTYIRLATLGSGNAGSYPYGSLYLPVLPAGIAPQTITFANFTKTYGDPDFDGGAVSSSGLPVTYASSDTTVATIVNGQIHITGAGTGHIVASQAGSADYAPATATDTITVNKASLTITAMDTSIIYGLPLPPFHVSYDGFVYGQDSSVLTVRPTVTALAARPVPDPGRYELLPSGAVSNNYAFNYVPGALTVTFPGNCLNAWMSAPRILTVTISAPSTQQVSLFLFNLMGRNMMSAMLNVQRGSNYFSFPVGGLSTGVYIVRIKGIGLDAVQKVSVGNMGINGQ